MVEIELIKEDDIHLIKVIGEVDASSSIELDNALSKVSADASKILVDLEELAYISSAGLGVFISYLEDLKTKGIKMVLIKMQATVLEVFEILGLQNLILITDTKEEGVRLLNEE